MYSRSSLGPVVEKVYIVVSAHPAAFINQALFAKENAAVTVYVGLAAIELSTLPMMTLVAITAGIAVGAVRVGLHAVVSIISVGMKI
jgi:hypothetical protein